MHLELFFRKAGDEEARIWIARKQVVAWSIANELLAENQSLQAITSGDFEELRVLKEELERERIDRKVALELSSHGF